LFWGSSEGLDSDGTIVRQRFPEILGHLFIWSLISELLGPFAFTRSAGDPLDVLAYAAGALVAGVWWNRQSLLGRVAGSSKPSASESSIQIIDK
jgi:hypothetical protein